MLRYVVLVSCFVILVQACDDHSECPVEFELQGGDLAVEYHAPDGKDFEKVIFRLSLGKRSKLTEVDEDPEDHEGHQDWDVVFSKSSPFVACDTHKIRVIGKGGPRFKRTYRVQIPGDNCPAN